MSAQVRQPTPPANLEGLLRARLSTFALESEAVVEPSTFIDDVASFGLSTRVSEDAVSTPTATAAASAGEIYALDFANDGLRRHDSLAEDQVRRA